MDSNINRWAQIVFWDKADLLDLIQREKSLATSLRQSARDGKRSKMLDWRDWRMLDRMQVKYALVPFWPTNLAAEVQAERMNQFKRAIFPIWKRIDDAAQKLDAAAASPAEYVCEEDTLHKMDLAIFDSGERPDRVYVSQEAIAQIRKKAVVGDRMKTWTEAQ